MKTKKQTESRHGKRAEGKAQTSITMSDDLLKRAREAAEKDGRSLSNWLEQLIKKSASLLIVTLALFHLTRSPKNWSAGALKQTVVAAVSWSSAQLNSITQK